MPFLDVRDFDDFTHLLQLYQAAHPDYQAQNEAMRESAARADVYFLSRAMVQDLAAWGLTRQLVTPADAQHMVAVMEFLHAVRLETQA
jgi:hypothetical protein